MIYLITYDLSQPHDTSEDYQRLIDGLKQAYGTWCHLEKSVWLISTTDSAKAVRDKLKQFIASSDKLFVAKLAGSWASRNLSASKTTWLKARRF